MATSSMRAYPSSGLLHPEPLPLQQSTVDRYLHSRHSNTVVSQSLWGPWVLVQGLFEPSEHLWWEWGLILNVNLPLLPSCWGFSFALGHGISPQSCSSAMQPPLQCCTAAAPVQEHSLFSTPSPAFIVCRPFDEGHSDQCEVISHCSFDMHFSNNEQC